MALATTFVRSLVYARRMNGSTLPPPDPQDTPAFDEAATVARLARCAAELYRRVPLEGSGLTGQAEELAHAADLDVLAASLESGADVNLDDVLLPRDVRVVSQLLIDVRRQPRLLDAAEVEIARAFFPEVEAETLEPLERLLAFWTGLLRP